MPQGIAVRPAGAISRRDFVAGLCASLALCFAPWEAFKRGLAGLLRKVYVASNATLESLTRILKARYPQSRIYDMFYSPHPRFACSADGVFSRAV